MVSYAVIDEQNESVREIRRFKEAVPAPSTKPGFRWVPVEDDPQPSHDPRRQQLERTETVEAGRVVRGWNVVALDADSRTEQVRQRREEVISGVLGTVEDRLSNLNGGVLLLDARGPGSNDPDAQQLRAVGAWAKSVADHAADLIAQIDQGGDPEIETGWPTPPGP